MLPFDQAQQRIVASARTLPAESVALPSALDRVLAEDVFAASAIPPFDYSAMDGYALASADAEAGPTSLLVRGESRAGHATPTLAPGTACRIFTGAPLPAGADCVLIQENASASGDSITFTGPLTPGANVRRRGEDLQAGALALQRGTRLGAAQLGLLATLDRAVCQVAERPRVAIVPTGDELRAPGTPGRAGSIPESNSVALAALVQRAGGVPWIMPITPDDMAGTERALLDAAARADVIVTIGGVSVGDHDLVRGALERAGATLDFWKVRMKPGKPLAFGALGPAFVLGVPGNPVSAQVTFSLFGMALLRALQGDRSPIAHARSATLTQDVRQNPGRAAFLRALSTGDEVTPLANQASGAGVGMAWANALLVIPHDSTGYAAGSRVTVYHLQDF